VGDDGVTNKEGKGTQDKSIMERATKMELDLKADRKIGENSSAFKR
jgi:hypothetical protein